ncbi:Uncharacterized membrane protein [Anaerobranca californiensis DSM 14826]|jgi:uncharacterized membrane protein|uniref:Uncharacterized membrane protein n=1 Tax=Anaerobranca californiensis DSM 14826 TaxID=1120989 RepID=A0A1M6LJH8_9FIRM|nr:ECF transporter S component [Anaerobranca californiensis]SHJ71320.1 Uncharacterized membrane protein [Anaerobranca californiensis DSM 14826]
MGKEKKLVIYSFLVALVAFVTAYVSFPIAFGYINLGDAIIFSSALVFGPFAGMIAGAVGSALADIILGYAQWAPFTFVIKGLEGYIVGLASLKFLEWGFKNFKVILLLLVAVLILNVGYFIAAVILYDFPAAIADAPLNIVQGIVALGLTLVLAPSIKRIANR